MGQYCQWLDSESRCYGEVFEGVDGETKAEEITLFEKATFLAVMKVTSEIGKKNPYPDRDEKMSNIIKTFKASLA